MPDITLAPGEGLLVSGPSGSGKSSLFRALAGLWSLGDGRVRLPRGGRVLDLGTGTGAAPPPDNGR